MFPVAHIVVTGGPVGGKSTLLSDGWLAQKMMDIGVRPFFVPEVATSYFADSIRDIAAIEASNYDRYVDVQHRMIHEQQQAYIAKAQMTELFRAE